MAEVTNIVVCPSCGAENIEGVDTCENCMMDLRTSDVPDTARAISDSPFLDPVGRIRLAKPVTVPATATVREAIDVLAGEPTGAVVVVNATGIVGIFTERDVLKRVAGAAGVLDGPLTAVMTPDPVVLRDDDTVATALNKMGSGGFRHIPMTRGGRLAGMVTAREALHWVMSRYFDF